MGGCQNYGVILVPSYNTAPNLSGTQKGLIILTTTHIAGSSSSPQVGLYELVAGRNFVRTSFLPIPCVDLLVRPGFAMLLSTVATGRRTKP